VPTVALPSTHALLELSHAVIRLLRSRITMAAPLFLRSCPSNQIGIAT
jgi:hypothetical protein